METNKNTIVIAVNLIDIIILIINLKCLILNYYITGVPKEDEKQNLSPLFLA